MAPDENSIEVLGRGLAVEGKSKRNAAAVRQTQRNSV
jgi:hypothetical protein